MSLETAAFVTGPLQTNTYLLVGETSCCVVDPGFDPGEVVAFLRDRGCTAETVLLTHGHGDHIAGVAAIQEAFEGAKLLCPAEDAYLLSDVEANLSGPFGFAFTAPPADELVRPGDTISLANETWNVLDTSGHTPGGVSYYCREQAVVLTGDALFCQGIGRTDIPGASAARLFANIRGNLFALPDQTRVLPGHGPPTTIAAEKPYLGPGPTP